MISRTGARRNRNRDKIGTARGQNESGVSQAPIRKGLATRRSFAAEKEGLLTDNVTDSATSSGRARFLSLNQLRPASLSRSWATVQPPGFGAPISNRGVLGP